MYLTCEYPRCIVPTSFRATARQFPHPHPPHASHYTLFILVVHLPRNTKLIPILPGNEQPMPPRRLNVGDAAVHDGGFGRAPDLGEVQEERYFGVSGM